MQGFWASCLSRFEKELPAQQFNTWIRPLKLDASAAPSGELRLLAPNRFVLQWVKERFVPRIEAMGAEFFSSPIRVSLTLETADAPEPIKTSAPAIRAARTLAPRSPHAERSSLIQNSASTALSPEKPISWRAPPRCRSPNTLAHRTTRSSSTVAWAWERPT